MDIKLEFEKDKKGQGTYGATFTIGDYKLKAIKVAASPSCCDRSKDKVAYSYLHPFPYMACAFLPEDMRERAAIVDFIKANSEKIEKEYGLVFEIPQGETTFKGYERECAILGVENGDTKEDIRNKYREKSLQWHPDRWIGKTEGEIKVAEDKFKEISSAYESLNGLNFYGISLYVTDLNAKHMYYLYEDYVKEQKENRINSLRF